MTIPYEELMKGGAAADRAMNTTSCWFEGTCDRDETHVEALKSVARWVMRDDLSVERRLAAIRRVAHEALSGG